MNTNNLSKWKTCEHCQCRYAPTSNRSRFCSGECKVHFMSRPNEAGCWIWQGRLGKAGYGYTNNMSASTTAHAFSFMTFKGEIPSGIMVCHRCDVRSCVNPEHLFLGTQADNMRDCAIKGRNKTKLTVEQVAEIRSAVNVSKAELARRHGVTDVMIGKIIRREWWKDVGRVD